MTNTIRTLLDGAVDYAGLFPPAQLSMRDAVARYNEYRTSPHAWMLGRFVVPVSRLEELAAAMNDTGDTGPDPWRLSVIVDDPVQGIAKITTFNDQNARAVADVIEVRALTPDDVSRIAAAVEGAGLRAFVEVPIADDPAAFIEAIADAGLGAKIRTGGVVSSAIPRAEDVARFLAHCVRAGIAFKATAGLHHPLRGEYKLTYDKSSPTGLMFGYLNVFLAAALLRNGGTVEDAAAMLDERDPSSISIDAAGATWRGRFIQVSAIASLRREALAGFGSCSFTEPVDEIVALGFA